MLLLLLLRLLVIVIVIEVPLRGCDNIPRKGQNRPNRGIKSVSELARRPFSGFSGRLIFYCALSGRILSQPLYGRGTERAGDAVFGLISISPGLYRTTSAGADRGRPNSRGWVSSGPDRG